MNKFIKTFLPCIVLCMPMLTTSCSDDNDNPNISNSHKNDGKIHIINNCSHHLDYLKLHTSFEDPAVYNKFGYATFDLDLEKGETFETEIPEGFTYYYISVRCPYSGHNHFSKHYKEDFYLVLTDELLRDWKNQDDPIHTLQDDWNKDIM